MPEGAPFLPLSGGTVTGVISHVNNGYQFNIASNNLADPTTQWWKNFTYAGNAGGVGAPLTGNAYVNTVIVSDQAHSNPNVNVYGLSVQHSVAANNNSASGGRVAFNAHLSFEAGSGTVNAPGIHSGAVIDAWCDHNLSGTASLYAGALNGANVTTHGQGGATYLLGVSGFEVDTSWDTGSSYGWTTQLLLVSFAQVRGLLNDDAAMVVGAGPGLPTMKTGIRFGEQASRRSLDPYARVMFINPTQDGITTPIASGVDFGNAVIKAFTTRGPYRVEVPLQATNITGATRLTSDGGAAVGFIYDAYVVNGGSGFTINPTITLNAAGSGAILTGVPGLGNVLAKVGIPTPGSAVKAEAAVVSTTPGTGAAIGLVIAGNTLNFPINSVISVTVTLVATTMGHGGTDAVGWRITFMATMGATASTTAIVGSPTWALDYQTTGAAAKFSGSAPAVPVADTTLGAINLTITPTTGAWDVGGVAVVTKTSRA